MSVRVLLPGAGGCVGSASVLPRVHVSSSARASRAVLLGDGVLRLRSENSIRIGRLSVPQCIASDAASLEVKAGNSVENASENVAEETEMSNETEVSNESQSEESKEASGYVESDSAPESSDEKDENKEAARRTWQYNQALRARRNQDWTRAESFRDRGGIFQGKIEACNQGGVLLRFYSLRGFLPYSQLSIARLPRDASKTITDVGKELIGQTVPCMVVEVDRRNRRLVFSERKALWVQHGSKLPIGSAQEGQVTGVVDYGAFVDIRLPDGTYPAVGLVHAKEMSWDVVTNPRSFLTVGQDVKVKVIGVDEENMKLALSIRQLEPDPLMETLDTLMPKESPESESAENIQNTPLPGIDEICDALEKESGISAVTLGRQKLEKHVVSQDLELWLSQTPKDDGEFTLLARAGRQVQEVHVTTSLGREEMKVAVQRVTKKLP